MGHAQSSDSRFAPQVPPEPGKSVDFVISPKSWHFQPSSLETLIQPVTLEYPLDIPSFSQRYNQSNYQFLNIQDYNQSKSKIQYKTEERIPLSPKGDSPLRKFYGS